MTALHIYEKRQAAPRHGAKPVSRAEFEALRARLEDMEDKFELLRAQASGPGEDALPGEYVDRLLAGETPLRIWREFRHMTLDQLSKATGIAKGYLSEVENGKKPGSAASLKACAKALEIDLDDLVRS
ncbi:MAG: helix-turn-helix transcriptional regulator [Alphaproteobacteria bacterium]|nr:helix-turn-helix transcriptional regulator [Alphaproteobacteria bacterium]